MMSAGVVDVWCRNPRRDRRGDIEWLHTKRDNDRADEYAHGVEAVPTAKCAAPSTTFQHGQMYGHDRPTAGLGASGFLPAHRALAVCPGRQRHHGRHLVRRPATLTG